MIAVIFTSQRTKVDDKYSEINDKLEALAAKEDGFLRVNSLRDDTGFGISVSYWKDMESAKKWKNIPQHLSAQEAGKTKWYTWYHVEVCELVREYRFDKS